MLYQVLDSYAVVECQSSSIFFRPRAPERTSVGAIVGPVNASRFVFHFGIVGQNLRAAERGVSAGELQRFCHFFQGQAPNITQVVSTGGASVVDP